MVQLKGNGIYFLVGIKKFEILAYVKKKCQKRGNSKTDFSLTSANKPQSSLVSYLQV